MSWLSRLLDEPPIELEHPLPPGELHNADLAPTTLADRTWSRWNIAALWVGMSVCIPTYMLASSMILAGMSWRMAIATIILGNAIVLIPLALNGHAGTKYGIPFPAMARAAYGTRGAHVPSLLRSVVACGWFGIQTWIGGTALHVILATLWPGWDSIGGGVAFMGHTTPEYLAFLVFWAMNVYFVWAGTESIRWLETAAAPFLLIVGLALLAWAASAVGGIGVILERSDQLAATSEETSTLAWFFGFFMPWLTAMVGYWATLSLNIPDFTRYARSQRDQVYGQAIGLLTTMPLFAFIGVAVTAATVILFGEAIWNPVDLLARLTADAASPLLGVGAMAVLAIATLSTNIAANVVAPANSLSALMPRRISFRTGGLLAALAGILIMPWRLLEAYQGWLISYSGLLGAVGGVMICDYLVLRRTKLDVEGLYKSDGPYHYANGVNYAAMTATAAGILTALVGLWVPSLYALFEGAWFSAAFVSCTVYWLMMRDTIASPGPIQEEG
ncbi:MAG: nitrate reductase [Acidobacteria bacterium]|nr:nitrate reductase [Acidobacteriota bacterium]